MHSFKSDLIKTNVTVVKFFKNCILAAVGGTCYIYDRNGLQLIHKAAIFEGHAIYGIDTSNESNKILTHSANKIKVLLWENEMLEELCHVENDDWVLTAKLIENSTKIASVSMHNKVTLWTSDLKPLQSATCRERCISYCATIAFDDWDSLVILSGTVFTEILLWQPKRCENEEFCDVKARLKGHEGVIFSIDYHDKSGLICSTSDDRYAIVWEASRGSLLKEIGASLKYKLYGHCARVFRCKILDKFILTAGEDSILCVWDLEGKLIKSKETHQGSSIWALDCDESNNLLATGGGDSGVTLFPIITPVKENRIHVEDGIPKKLAILNSNNIVIVTNDGKLKYYDVTLRKWIQSFEHEDLKTYALLEVSLCANMIALAGYHGSIKIYAELKSKLYRLWNFETISKGRIYSFHWLHCSVVMICEPDGILSLWSLNKNVWHLEFTFSLPPAKERWTTAACMLSPLHYAVGDRKGHIYLYYFGQKGPVQIIKNAHNYLGITNLYVNGSELISLGRNSQIRRYKFCQETHHLDPVSTDKLPFSWLGTFCQGADTDILIGFSGTNLIIWDYSSRRVLLEHNCGGGHRSWAFKKSENLKLMYLKDKYVNEVTCDWKNLIPIDLISGYHLREINTITTLKLNSDKEEYVVVSGGEDTTLRLSTIDGNGSFRKINVLKHHLSNIRAIEMISYLEGGKKKHLIFSGGGRAQIILWELEMNSGDITCIEKDSYYDPNEDESEVRVMDLCPLKVDSNIILFSACSDGRIKIFTIDAKEMNNKTKIKLRSSIFYKLNCILKVEVFSILNRYILISTATDGNIVLWDITDTIKKLRTDNSAEFISKNIEISPASIFKSHQSSINSLSLKILSENVGVVLTGGDDNAFSLRLLKFSFSDQFEVESLDCFDNSEAHCAHITGCFLSNSYLITSSVDQSVILFKWYVSNDRLYCEKLAQHNSAVADLQGMECLEFEDCFKIFIYGNGIEALTLMKR